jgi:hypothetical protein
MNMHATREAGSGESKHRGADPRLYRARFGIEGTYRGYTEDGCGKMIFRAWSFTHRETRRPVSFIFPISFWERDDENAPWEKSWSVERRPGERQPHLPGSVLFGKCNFDRLPNVMVGDTHIDDWCRLALDVMSNYNARQQQRRAARR